MVARWGGNEFMVLLPTANSEAAVNIAERLRVRPANWTWMLRATSCEFPSVWVWPQLISAPASTTCISTAENGLYQAKHMGRDMVIVG